MSKEFEEFKKQAAEKLRSGGSLLGKEGVFTDLLREVLEAGLSGELDAHVDETRSAGNRKNGSGTKRVRSSLGTVEIRTPRDRQSSFEPQLVGKRDGSLGADLDRQILALYGMGTSLREISAHLQEMYQVEVSEATISRVTDQIIPVLEEWRGRPLDGLYPFVWMDAIHYKVRHEGRVTPRAVYCVIGMNLEGRKEVLGMYLGEQEGASFWMKVLGDLQLRGVKDILIASIDNLKGFAEAIESIFPKTEVQLCVIHQVRNSQKYIPWKERRAFLQDLRSVYSAASLELAEQRLDVVEQKWALEKGYPMAIQSWRTNWPRLTAYFQYPAAIRRFIYTTNLIENFHRGLRKVTKTKGAFTSEMALMKQLYLAQEKITQKWTVAHKGWPEALGQLWVIFKDRITSDPQ